MERSRRLARFVPWARIGCDRARTVLSWTVAFVMPFTIAAGVAYHAIGGDIQKDLVAVISRLTWEQVSEIGWAAAMVLGLIVAARFLLSGLRAGRTRVEARVVRWLDEGRGANSTALTTAVPTTAAPMASVVPHSMTLLEWYGVAATILGTIWLAAHVMRLPPLVGQAVGFLFRMTSIVVLARLLTLGFQGATEPLLAIGNRHLTKPLFVHYWERLSRLAPFARRCLEWTVYVAAATLCVGELGFIPWFVRYGVSAIQCIGLFFGARVLIELAAVLLNESFGLYDDRPRTGQQGQTLVPLLQSASQYAIYFAAGVMGLEAFGQSATPVLAAMGVMGLAAGLGAQSLVNDVVSGFFILFEGQYLVGDYVQVGQATGTVEAVAVRHTRIRDEQGKLHIIPNGSVKEVVNYSKGYVNAIVELKVPARSDIEAAMRAMSDVGARLRRTRPEILGETTVQGIVDLNLTDMTLRAVTRVRPGAHLVIQNEFRRQLREALGDLLAGESARAA